jgi:hypothetical protein
MRVIGNVSNTVTRSHRAIRWICIYLRWSRIITAIFLDNNHEFYVYFLS